ncbi:hypothetical protein DPMN_088976 [Dreissena polymorpha]|uniref:Uncharacterized protein n=1 Tax=Dreissena polymorpha TaxID=45954 RepID=A0A9D4QX03_DREPO|nr:hypothetical protein DPMN_088976 [Dreissena polymorpha]
MNWNKNQQPLFDISAYWIANNELPFTLYPSVLDLQKINGVELVLSYKTDMACRRFMTFIYKDLQSVTDDLLKQSEGVSYHVRWRHRCVSLRT